MHACMYACMRRNTMWVGTCYLHPAREPVPTHEGAPPGKNDPTQMMECTLWGGYD